MVLFRVGTCPPFHRFLYHGEMVLFAERIRQLADAVVILRIRLMVFMTVYAGDRIYYQVVVDMDLSTWVETTTSKSSPKSSWANSTPILWPAQV